jgi:hypothetical protein
VGRIAAIRNQGHIDRYNEQIGFFGFFESIDDQEVAHRLFDAVRDWFAAQNIRWLRGPTNPSLNHELGTLIEGFDSPPTFMMTYNPPYHASLIESYGFRKSQDLYAYWGEVSMLPAIHKKLEPFALQVIERLNLKIRPLDKKHFTEDVMRFLDVYNQSLTNTWGFVPMSNAEVAHTAKSLRFLMVPELALAAEVDGRMVGAVFGLLDYNPRIKLIDGRLFPFGFMRLLWKRHSIKKVRLISTNVIPEFQLFGVSVALMHSMVPKALEFGLEEAEFSWVLESNKFSRGSLEKGGAKRTKTYRIYDWQEQQST